MRNTERLRLLYCDHLSLARGKYLPLKDLKDGGAGFCRTTFGVHYDKDLLPAPGAMMLEGCPDMEAKYLSSDIRESWNDEEHVVVGDLYDTDGNVLALCGRQALKRAIAEWEIKDLHPMIGIELEATAFVFNEDGHLEPYHTPGGFVYGTGPFSDPAGFTDAIWRRASEIGFNLDMISSEYFTPQFEFTLTFDRALKAVDDTFLFRLMAREIALEHGILLTFLPKPIPDIGGLGMHVNVSFQDAEGNNCIQTDNHLGELAEGCIAGWIHHHRGMTALLAPTVTSYLRLEPASLSGYWANWAIDHRNVTTRISSEKGERARLEHRTADFTANPYTAVATLLQAAKLGVEKKYPLPPAETKDCFEEHDATVSTPETLSEALEELEKDSPLTTAVGQELVDNLIFMKNAEVDKTKHLEGDGLRDWYIHYL